MANSKHIHKHQLELNGDLYLTVLLNLMVEEFDIQKLQIVKINKALN